MSPCISRRTALGGFAAIATLLATGSLPGTEPSAVALTVPSEVTILGEVSFEAPAGSVFTHPGIGVTAAEIANVRAQLAAGAEPWSSYYAQMLRSATAGTAVVSSNRSSADPTKPAATAFNSQSFNSRFIADGLKAYTQALIYALTGDPVRRDNAMAIIRIWEQMDPAGYQYFTDAHIHTGIPLYRMVTAAEILRYGSCATDSEDSAWTEEDTAAFTDRLITPVVETFQHDQNHFMNQHTYPLIGAMAAYLFTENEDRYAEAVEWFTVNSTAEDAGFNGSVQRLFRLVETDDATGEAVTPHVQHVEMGRDQAHGGGDITNAYLLSRMMMAQGTTVDPVEGTISTASDAVGPYEFLDDRILAAAEYFWTYMLGHDPEWTPVGYAISADGTVRDTYDEISIQYRGRYNTASFWDLHYYYTYERGLDLAESAPNLEAAFAQRLPLEFGYRGSTYKAWESADAGGEFWLHVPAGAAGTSVPVERSSTTVFEIEDRWTPISGTATAGSEGGTGYVRLSGSGEGTTIAFRNGSSTGKTVALRLRSTGTVTLSLSFGFSWSAELPDTGGEWRDVVIALQAHETVGDLFYVTATGTGSVDLDHLDIKPTGSVPAAFTSSPARVVAVNGERLVTSLAGEGDALTAISATGLPKGASVAADATLTWAPKGRGTTSALLVHDDGEVLATRGIELVAASNRSKALAAALEPYDASEVYTAASLAVLEPARKAAEAGLASSDFLTLLQDLVRAVDALELVSPRLPGGDLDWPAVLSSSTIGDSAPLLVDGDRQTGTSYTQSVDLGMVLDFGPFARISATSFDLQSDNFEDRLANAAVFGSNDGSAWTRLTPGVTEMTQAMQHLDVAEDLRDERFQMIKVQILDPLPDVLYGLVRSIFEIMEFRIHGTRYETAGAIDSVSISAPGSMLGRVVVGDAVVLTAHAFEDVSDVIATVGGTETAMTSTDARTWTATVTVPEGAATGATLAFSIRHTRADGSDGGTVASTSDGSSVFVSSNEGLIDSVLASASVSGDDGVPSSSLATDASHLFDLDTTTYTDTRLVGSRASLVWDLGETAAASVAGADVLVRQDGYGTSRLSTLRLEGSADLESWTALTSSVKAQSSWQRISGQDSGAYRYVRLTNGNIINVAEMRVFGAVASVESAVTGLSLASSNSLGNYAVDGDTATLTITTNGTAQDLTVTIDGSAAAVVDNGNGTFTAQATVVVGDRIGESLAFTVAHTTASGAAAPPLRATTDGSSVRLGTDEGLIGDLTKVAAAVTLSGAADTSTVARPASLFDGSLSTYTDARVIDGSADIVLDLGQGGGVAIDRVELALRQDSYGTQRAKAIRLMGSDDLSSWTALTGTAAATLAWQGLDSLDTGSHRYLRITNTQILGIAELRLYGSVTAAGA